MLLEIIRLTANGPAVEPLAAAVARMITEATATDVCFVHILDDTERTLILAGATSPFDDHVGQVQLPLGMGVSGWVASHRTPVVITEDKESDPRYLPLPALRGTEFISMASIPMESDRGGLVGVLNVHTVERREFSPRDLELLHVIGRLVAGALDQARQHRRLAMRERAHERFVEQVIANQEAERRRMAGDIHDGISQRLISLSYHLDAATHAVDDDAVEVAVQLAHARDLLGLALDEARVAIGGLRPPILDDLGLAGGLASLARSTPQLPVDIAVDDERLPEHVELALYRIAQEGLQNIVKHAAAALATLRFRVHHGVARLDVSDDGVGFDVTRTQQFGATATPSGYGLASMTERAELVGGRLRIRSRRGVGTTVTVTVPLGHQRERC
ncbi:MULTISPECIES: GAF domain-containing sensor histidine kinase [Pseudonocardia]|uniref:GAF domain-containing sensor histidine kinase n=1 Tax=Pseudonocardia TaxID=1847 RepID=UPI001E41C7D7|nr:MULTISPECIES: GAF domain-containing sensor histidine kinase [Pseudonocardia]